MDEQQTVPEGHRYLLPAFAVKTECVQCPVRRRKLQRQLQFPCPAERRIVSEEMQGFPVRPQTHTGIGFFRLVEQNQTPGVGKRALSIHGCQSDTAVYRTAERCFLFRETLFPAGTAAASVRGVITRRVFSGESIRSSPVSLSKIRRFTLLRLPGERMPVFFMRCTVSSREKESFRFAMTLEYHPWAKICDTPAGFRRRSAFGRTVPGAAENSGYSSPNPVISVRSVCE